MPNFYNDNPDLLRHFANLDLRAVVESMENGYRDSGRRSDAPADYTEAMETYESALSLLGDICANAIAPLSAKIDAEGTRLVNGEVVYAAPTNQARSLLADSGFMGVMLPREHGGSAFPATVYMMMIEMVSRADASLMTLFGYQDVGELIARFGSPEQARQFLPDLASGKHIGAIVLSEPGAGSDLQAIKLKAREDGDGNWTLAGTKHFISNGCGDVLMVLARSEPGISNIFGLSLFVCPRSDRVRVTRIEEKMGLHGSPTCELQFDDAPAQLIGQRKVGLTRYVLESLNQARFSVAAQAIGIAEAAYRMARDYAQQRTQFGQTIVHFPAVRQMLLDMHVALASSRALLYEGVFQLDLRNQLAHRIEECKKSGGDYDEIQRNYRISNNMVSLLSPMVKYAVTEAAIKICYDAQQIFGGMGYIKETGIERLVRDVRITTIYEGTSQIQVAASIKYVMADILASKFDEFAAADRDSSLDGLYDTVFEIRDTFKKCIAILVDRNDKYEIDAAARSLVDCYCQTLCGYLLLDQAKTDNEMMHVAHRYLVDAQASSVATLERVSASRYSRQFDRQQFSEVS